VCLSFVVGGLPLLHVVWRDYVAPLAFPRTSAHVCYGRRLPPLEYAPQIPGTSRRRFDLLFINKLNHLYVYIYVYVHTSISGRSLLTWERTTASQACSASTRYGMDTARILLTYSKGNLTFYTYMYMYARTHIYILYIYIYIYIYIRIYIYIYIYIYIFFFVYIYIYLYIYIYIYIYFYIYIYICIYIYMYICVYRDTSLTEGQGHNLERRFGPRRL